MSAQSAVVKATAAGQIFYATGNGQISALAKGTTGHVLTTGNAPSWVALRRSLSSCALTPPMPPGASPLDLAAVAVKIRSGGGGGGGAGIRDGGGGGGGMYVEGLILASELSSTESIVFGNGGASGGAAGATHMQHPRGGWW